MNQFGEQMAGFFDIIGQLNPATYDSQLKNTFFWAVQC